jgi:cytoskeletal protein CcmA (bactofilin family)
MFGSKQKKAPLIEISKLSSLIAEDVEITGDLHFAAGLRIDGTLKGNAVGKPGEGKRHSLLVLSDKGRVEGSIRCYDAVINGSVTGDLIVEHFLELQPNAHVTGTIRYLQLQMDVGAVVEGMLNKTTSSEATATVVELEQARSAG